MKPHTWYTLLIVALTVNSYALPTDYGYAANVCWATACGGIFGALVVKLAQANLIGLTAWSLLVTAILPICAISFIAAPTIEPIGSGFLIFIRDSLPLLPLSGAEFVLPTTAALFAGHVVKRYFVRHHKHAI